MNEELNKELEQEVKDETSMPEETMEDYAAELEASYQTLNKRNIEAAEDESGEMEKWNNFVQMKEDHTVVKVKIVEAVKGGVVGYLDDVRAFIPGSHVSTEYVENLEDFKGKTLEAVVITADPENKKLVLSARQVEKDKKEAARKERMAQFKAGDVVEGTVDSIKDYGAFIKLADGVDGLLHVSQIAKEHVDKPADVLKTGQEITAKVVDFNEADKKISLSIKALLAPEPKEVKEETVEKESDADVVSVDIDAVIAGQKDDAE